MKDRKRKHSLIKLPLKPIKELIRRLGNGIDLKLSMLFGYPTGFLGLILVTNTKSSSSLIYLVDLNAMRTIGWFDLGVRKVLSVSSVKACVNVRFQDGTSLGLSLYELEGVYTLMGNFRNWDWECRRKYQKYIIDLLQRYMLIHTLYLVATNPLVGGSNKVLVKELLAKTEGEVNELTKDYPHEFLVDG